MKKIFKYQLSNSSKQNLSMTAKAEIISVQVQKGKIVMWAIIDTEESFAHLHTIYVIGTGYEMPNVNLQFLNTIQFEELGLVFHVFLEV
jgi:ArsR family metal-binding transcriptional regulator